MNNDTIFDISERKKRLAKTALNEVLKELKKEGILVGYDNVEGCFYVADAVLAADRTHYDTEASGEYVLRNRIDLDKDLTRFFGTNAAEGYGPVFKGDRDMDESRRPRGRMLKEGGLLGDYWCPDSDYEDPYVDAYGHECECVACGKVFREIEGVCKNDIGRIFCKDCWDKLYGDKEKNESRRYRGRMLKEEDERLSLVASYFDGWSEDGKNYENLNVKKNGKNTPVMVCVVFTDKGEHLDTVFYSIYKPSEDLTENEVAEELDVSVGDIKKLVEKAKIEAMKKFE